MIRRQQLVARSSHDPKVWFKLKFSPSFLKHLDILIDVLWKRTWWPYKILRIVWRATPASQQASQHCLSKDKINKISSVISWGVIYVNFFSALHLCLPKFSLDLRSINYKSQQCEWRRRCRPYVSGVAPFIYLFSLQISRMLRLIILSTRIRIFNDLCLKSSDILPIFLTIIMSSAADRFGRVEFWILNICRCFHQTQCLSCRTHRHHLTVANRN